MTASAAPQAPVLIVESERAFAQAVQQALFNFGQGAVVVENAEQAESFVKETRPSLVLLCVELPGRSGYSVCNKLKKAEQFQSIPIIIMSSQATPEVFDRHREMKVRADDYVIKPVAVGALIERVGRFVELPEAAGGDLGEVEVLPVEDTGTVTVARAPAAKRADEEIVIDSTNASGMLVIDDEEQPALEIDRDIEVATDAAFDAIAPDSASDGGPGERPVRSRAAQTTVRPVPADAAASAAASGDIELAPPPAPPLVSSDVSGAVALEPLGVAAAPVAAPAAPEPLPPVDDGQLRALQQKVDDAEAENRRLARELDGAKQAAVQPVAETPSGGLSRDRELLSLREVINKKEKEILDLKDDLDAKERQILEHRDKVRQLERRLQDLDDKMLGVEREMMGSRERITALEHDKTQAQERETALKGRLDQAKTEINKAYQENDDLKQRHQGEIAAVEQRVSTETAGLKQASDEALAQAKEAQLAEVDRLRGQQQRELTEVEQRYKDQLAAEQGKHGQALEEKQQEIVAAQRHYDDQLAGAEARHRNELTELSQQQREEQQKLTAQHEGRLQDEVDRAAAQLEDVKKEHSAALARQNEAHETAQQEQVQRADEQRQALITAHQRELEARDATYAGEKESLRTTHQADLERAKGEHEQAMAGAAEAHGEALAAARRKAEGELEELERQHADQLAGTSARHQQETIQLKDTHAQAISERDGQISDFKNQVSTVTTDLGAAREDIAKRDAELERLTRQAREIQERLIDAYNKIRHDEDLADKVKRALAIGIALVEEHQKMQVNLPAEAGPELSAPE